MNIQHRLFAIVVLISMLAACIASCVSENTSESQPAFVPSPESSADSTEIPVIPWDLVVAKIAFDGELIYLGENAAPYIELGNEIICNVDIRSKSIIDGKCEIVIQFNGSTIATHTIALKAKQREPLRFTLKPEVRGKHRINVYLTDGHSLASAFFHVTEPFSETGITQVKVKDIKFIMGEAEKIGIQVQSVVHGGDIITVTCSADHYPAFGDYLTALEESGLFSTPIPPPEGYPYTKTGTIELEPKFQDINMSVVDFINQVTSITDSDAIYNLVKIAEESGIDIDPNAGKFVVPSAIFSETKVSEWPCQVLSFRNIQLQSDYQNVIAFISNLGPDKDAGVTLKTAILKSISMDRIEQNGEIEIIAVLSVDIYIKP